MPCALETARGSAADGGREETGIIDGRAAIQPVSHCGDAKMIRSNRLGFAASAAAAAAALLGYHPTWMPRQRSFSFSPWDGRLGGEALHKCTMPQHGASWRGRGGVKRFDTSYQQQWLPFSGSFTVANCFPTPEEMRHLHAF